MKIWDLGPSLPDEIRQVVPLAAVRKSTTLPDDGAVIFQLESVEGERQAYMIELGALSLLITDLMGIHTRGLIETSGGDVNREQVNLDVMSTEVRADSDKVQLRLNVGTSVTYLADLDRAAARALATALAEKAG